MKEKDILKSVYILYKCGKKKTECETVNMKTWCKKKKYIINSQKIPRTVNETVKMMCVLKVYHSELILQCFYWVYNKLNSAVCVCNAGIALLYVRSSIIPVTLNNLQIRFGYGHTTFFLYFVQRREWCLADYVFGSSLWYKECMYITCLTQSMISVFVFMKEED